MGNLKLLTAWQQEINNYLVALSRLYGVFEPRQFLKVFNKYHEDISFAAGAGGYAIEETANGRKVSFGNAWAVVRK